MRFQSRFRAWRPQLTILLGLLLATLPAIAGVWGSEPFARANDPSGHPMVRLLDAVGLTSAQAASATISLLLCLGAAGAFWFGRTLSNRSGGWLGALAYLYNPFVLNLAMVTGHLPALQAAALLPFVSLALWGAAHRHRGWETALPLLLAGMLLTDVAQTLSFGFVLSLWLFWLAGHDWRARLLGPSLGVILGGALAAFFWLPPLMAGLAPQGQMIAGQGSSSVGVTAPTQLLSAFLPAEGPLADASVVWSLPLAALSLGLLSLAVGWRVLGRERRRHALGFLALLLPAIWLATPASAFVWRLLPESAAALASWQFLGPVSWMAAGLLAIAAPGLPGMRLLRRWRSVWPLLGTVLLVGAATPWLFSSVRMPAAEIPVVSAGWEAPLSGAPWPWRLAPAETGVLASEGDAVEAEAEMMHEESGSWPLYAALVSTWALLGLIPLLAFVWPRLTQPARPLPDPYAMLAPVWFVFFGGLAVAVWLVFALVDTPLT